ncbi:hypothetical protein FG93_05869 [Bosea sp. LC85]|uniref:hypothetical protein n=1 Tax=Bosea sp. LC85 TaxID=1502851 RepID=UPI0004E4028D|nr:hypothetical protein [Bosea sp. LC85]KFC63741.1 hypothetical protein FG93_05869 [Bosea sp. LC85]
MARTTVGRERDQFFVALAALVMSAPSPGVAGDGDLQRALLDSGCANAKVTRLPDQGKIVIYRANCFSTGHKVIELVCIAGRCTASSPSSEDERGR